MKKNIVFITTDHQRSDTINMIQDGKEVTPNLNRLVEEGIHFERAYTTCPLSVPARTALATGIFPTKSKVVINDLKNISEETKKLKSLHEYLDQNGYDVSHFGMQHITLVPSLEERVNFEKIITDDDYEKLCKEKKLPLFGIPEDRVLVKELHGDKVEERNYTGSRVSFFNKDINLFRDRYYINNCLEFLEEKNNFEKPFAMFLNIWAPHPPFTLPKECFERFKNIKLPENINIPSKGEPNNRREGIAAQLAEEHNLEYWENVWRAYLGLTNYADELIGEVFKKLKDKGVYENSIIIFTADHGDHLGQHKMFQKMEMYDQAIKVPLIIKIPNIKPLKIQMPVSHLDILPTILEYLDIKEEINLDGESLMKYIEEKIPQDKLRNVYTQYSGNQVAIGDIRRSVSNSKFKYIYDPRDKEELYDLEKDSMEMNNLETNLEFQKIKLEMKNDLKEWCIDKKDWINIK
ncbi:MAG: sulfatase-like hydrolase/transferase [Cetobacterium sp.]|uniref:sulfatase-like hydrolase/transferase n=1 Tax=Cetobacterium sp. TaxID=2071632 RepID=UPI003F410479